jgi:hypothetical protein
MRAELPSKQADGTRNWVEYRDSLMSMDKFAVDEVATVVMGETGNKVSALAMRNDMRNALLSRIITAWSYPVPIPKDNNFQAADIVIGNALNLKDYSALAKAIEPLMDEIEGKELPDPKTPSGD